MNPSSTPDAELPPVPTTSADLSATSALSAFSGREALGYHDPPHSHDRGQFSYRTEGFALIKAGDRSIFLSPGRGVWIPAGVIHEVTCRGPPAYNAFYVEKTFAPQPEELRVIAVTPLLHALVEAMLAENEGCRNLLRQKRLSELILDEVIRAPDVGMMAPGMPRTPGLRAVCDRLSREPAQPLDLDGLAHEAGMSRRNFTWLFREETGLSPGGWHQQLRMHYADTLLAQQMSPQKVSFRLGYGSTASFMRAYVRTCGTSPRERGFD